MQNKSAVIITVLSVLAMAFVLASCASVGGVGDTMKQYNKRSDNSSELSVLEATKLCNQSFAIKMGKDRKNEEGEEHFYIKDLNHFKITWRN